MEKLENNDKNNFFYSIEKISFLIKNAGMHWHILMGFLIAIGLGSGIDIAGVKSEFQEKIQKIVKNKCQNLKENSKIKCSDIVVNELKNNPEILEITKYVSQKSFLIFLSLGGLVYLGTSTLPKNGRKNLINELIEKESLYIMASGKIPEYVIEFNKWREALGYQNYEDFLKMFRILVLLDLGKSICQKGNEKKLVFMKNHNGKWIQSLDMNGKYSDVIISNNTLNFAYYLEENGFRFDNIEIREGT